MLQFGEQLEPRAILTLLSRSVPYYLKSWHDIDADTGLFGTIDPHSFNMRDVGSSSPVIEYVIQPHVQVLCIIAAYIQRSEYDLLPFTDRAAIVEKVNKGILWACDTHLTGNRDVPPFLERKRWGENWQSSLWASMLGMSALLARHELSDVLFERVKQVVAFEADRFSDVLPPGGCEIDTKLEENAQDTMVIAWALALNPGHLHTRKWEKSLQVWAVNIASSIHDKADHSDYFGRSMSSAISTRTLFPDMTAENHGFFHPETLSYSMWIVLAMAAFTMCDKEPPAYLLRRTHQKTFEILMRFCLPSGMVFTPGGQDVPLFVPRPLKLAWGLWNNDPRAMHLTSSLLCWMDMLGTQDGTGPWVFNLGTVYDGWELYFQSRSGFELAMLATVPFPREVRNFTTGQVERAIDTRQIYPYVEVSYRRNTRTTRSVAWKAWGNHPTIGMAIHSIPELVRTTKASLLGIPKCVEKLRNSEVAFHSDRFQKDGFDTSGRIHYYDYDGNCPLSRDIRIITWGDDGLVVFDEIVAHRAITLEEHYLSPVYLVNDVWTNRKISFQSGSLHEVVPGDAFVRELACPAFWASIEDQLTVQLIWGRNKGLVYVPARERNAPPYWKNCRLDMLAMRVEAGPVPPKSVVYRVGFLIGGGKGPRPMKVTGTAGEFFKGLVVMDGKNTVGLD